MTSNAGHLSTKRNSIIILAIFIVVVAACSGIYYFNKVKPYNDLLTAANKAVTEEDYDNAIKLYTEAETYKKTSDIDNKIKLAGTLKNSKENYNSAVQKMKDKDYPGAMDLFKKVDKQDSKRYSDAQDKIKECKKLYDNLAKVKNAAASKKQNDQAGTSEASAGIPVANGPVSFDQALSMVLKAEFPDGKYAVIKEDDGTTGYVSLDSSILNGNKGVKCMADYRGRGIGYETKEAKPIEIWLNGGGKPAITRNCYEFNLSIGGHIPDGYYVEASTGKMYKHEYGNSRSLN